MERRARVFFYFFETSIRGGGNRKKLTLLSLSLLSFHLPPSAFDQPLKLTPEIAAATLRSATKTLHGSSGGAALPYVLLSVDSQASTATVRVSRQRRKGAKSGGGGSYSSSSSKNSVDPVAALVASLACVTRSPQLVISSSSSSRGGQGEAAAAATGGADETVVLPPQPLALTVVRRCHSVASLASDPRSFDPCAEIDAAAVVVQGL